MAVTVQCSSTCNIIEVDNKLEYILLCKKFLPSITLQFAQSIFLFSMNFQEKKLNATFIES